MIIGVAGQKKHGKDTVANYLVKNYGYTQRAFADNLKEVCSKVFDIPLEAMYDESLKEREFSTPILATAGQASKVIELAGVHMTEDQINRIYSTWMRKTYFHTIRDLLQFTGTDILRDIVDADYHYNTVVRYFRENNITLGVVSDVRFANERDNLPGDFPGAKTILVKRPGLQSSTGSGHKSENSLGEDGEYNFVITNGGTLQDLYSYVDTIMNSLNIQRSN